MLQQHQHPHIIRLLDSATYNKHPCLVLEYAEQSDLNKLIRKHREGKEPIPSARILKIFKDICLGLQFIHSKGIIHRDLKPSNILIAENGMAKLADFGLARSANYKDGKPMESDGSCTVLFCAPEIATDDLFHKPSDVWALGVILHLLCSLEDVAFVGKNIEDYMMSIFEGKYKPLPDHVCPELKEMVAAILVVDPGQRPTVDDLLASQLLSD